MIQFLIDIIAEQAIKNVVINIHHLPQKAIASLKALDWDRLNYFISDETDLLLGSGGGIKKASSFVNDECFFVCNADMITNIDFSLLTNEHEINLKNKNVLMTLALIKNPSHDTAYREIKIDHKNGLVQDVGDIMSKSIFYSGVCILQKSALDHIKENQPADFLKDILFPALRKKRVGFCMFSPIWEDIGSPKQWHQTHFKLMRLYDNEHLPKRWIQRLKKVNALTEIGKWSKEQLQKEFTNQCEAPFYWGGSGKTTLFKAYQIKYDSGEHKTAKPCFTYRNKIVEFD